MGWYDSFKGDISRVDTRGLTSSRGSAFKNLGDAFASIGKNMVDAKAQKSRSDLVDAETKQRNATVVKQEAEQAQKDVSDAFGKSYLGQTDRNAYESSPLYSAFASEDANVKPSATDLQAEDAYFKKIADESAYKNASLYNVGAKDGLSLDVWMQNNPNVSATTVAKVKAEILAKNAELSKLTTKEKDIKNATKLSKMQEKLNKAALKNSKDDSFKYTEITDAKIAAQVKTAMGMDAPNFNFDDATKVQYQNTVSGAAKISKKYKLEPSLAIHVYQNPDLYEFTADGNVLLKKASNESPKKTTQKQSGSWKDYQN